MGLLIRSAILASLGSFVFGIDSGLIASILAQESFLKFMFPPNGTDSAKEGAMVSVYSAGQAIGTYLVSPMADRFSRKRSIRIAALIAIVGTAIQTASVNAAMMITGRLIAGFSSGMLISIVPIYIAELSTPRSRGATISISGVFCATAFCLVNWIGYGGSFAKSPEARWRIPLAMQLPGATALFIASFFLPYSPRWLIQVGRDEEAQSVLHKLHDEKMGSDFAVEEFYQIRAQITLETEMREGMTFMHSLRDLFSKKFMRRTLTAIYTLTMPQLGGTAAIQAYQSKFYAAVGFVGQKALLISGIYGIMGMIGQVISLFVVDRFERKTMIVTGCFSLSALLAVLMSLSALYGDGSNYAGSVSAIAMIFLYSMTYAIFLNSTLNVAAAELFPFYLRSQGFGISLLIQSILGIVIGQISPIALDNIGWRYYIVFLVCEIFNGIVFFIILRKTRGKTLEEVAEEYGDVLAADHISVKQMQLDEDLEMTATAVAPSQTAGQDLKKTSRVEHAENAL